MSSVRTPAYAHWEARLPASAVLPVPPFCAAIAVTTARYISISGVRHKNARFLHNSSRNLTEPHNGLARPPESAAVDGDLMQEPPAGRTRDQINGAAAVTGPVGLHRGGAHRHRRGRGGLLLD